MSLSHHKLTFTFNLRSNMSLFKTKSFLPTGQRGIADQVHHSCGWVEQEKTPGTHPGDAESPGGTAWGTSCPSAFPLTRDLPVEPALPLMVVSFSTAHSGLGTSTHSSPLLQQHKCYQNWAFSKEKGGFVSIDITQTSDCLFCYLDCLKIHRTAWAPPLSPTKERFFLINLMKYISVVTNGME